MKQVDIRRKGILGRGNREQQCKCLSNSSIGDWDWRMARAGRGWVGTSLVVQSWGLHASNVWGAGSTPGQGTKISHAVWPRIFFFLKEEGGWWQGWLLQSPYSALSKKWTLESWGLTSDGTLPGLWLDPSAVLDKDQGSANYSLPTTNWFWKQFGWNAVMSVLLHIVYEDFSGYCVE